jgi:hypothetical protein
MTGAPAEVTTEPLPDLPPPPPEEAPDTEPEPAATAGTGATEETAEETTEEAAPPPPPDPETAACRARGGRMISGPGGYGRLCQTPTPDAGRPCTSARDCAGLCLARGNVCAPVMPLLGCHDILQSDGSRVTQCIE